MQVADNTSAGPAMPHNTGLGSTAAATMLLEAGTVLYHFINWQYSTHQLHAMPIRSNKLFASGFESVTSLAGVTSLTQDQTVAGCFVLLVSCTFSTNILS